jgi:hypothetical protein
VDRRSQPSTTRSNDTLRIITMPSIAPQLFTADDTRGSMKGKSPRKKLLSVCSLTKTRSGSSSTTTAATSMTLSQNQSPLLVSLVEVDQFPPLPPPPDMSPLTPPTPSFRKKLRKLSNLNRSRSKSSIQHRRPRSEPDLCAYLEAQSGDSGFLSAPSTRATTTTSSLPSRKKQIGKNSPKQTRSSEHCRRSLKSSHQHKRPNSEPDLCDFLEAQTSADSGSLSAPLTPATTPPPTTTASLLTSRKNQIGKKSPTQTRSSEHSRRSLKSSHQHERPNSEPDLCDYLEAQSADFGILSAPLMPATTITTPSLRSRRKKIGKKSPKQMRSSEHSRRSLKSSHQHERPNSEPDLCDYLKAQSTVSGFLTAPLTRATTTTTSSSPSRENRIGQKSPKEMRSSEHIRRSPKSSHQHKRPNSEPDLCDFLEAQTSADSGIYPPLWCQL